MTSASCRGEGISRSPILRGKFWVRLGGGVSIKIVLADNHQVVRQGLALLLDGEPDIEVVGEAGDWSATIKLIEKLSPHIVIMDICLPDTNGVEATRRIVSQFPDVKIIVVSMHSDSLFVLNLLNAGAAGYLLKDCALEELVKAIRTVMTQKIFLSSSLSNMLVKDLASRIQVNNDHK
jgi:two-component system response regulator NreC